MIISLLNPDIHNIPLHPRIYYANFTTICMSGVYNYDAYKSVRLSYTGVGIYNNLPYLYCPAVYFNGNSYNLTQKNETNRQ